MPRTSTTNIIKLYGEQDGKCFYCGDNLLVLVLGGTDVELDHKVPVVRSGASKVENYVLACTPCNRRKSEMSAERFLERIKPYRDGLIPKQDFLAYSRYIKLHKHFGHLINSGDFKPGNPITIAEYTEILGRFSELEDKIQEIFDQLQEQENEEQ